VSFLTELGAFFIDHPQCCDLDAGVYRSIVWIGCECGARMALRVDEVAALALDG
jgi:hypothetical protein